MSDYPGIREVLALLGRLRDTVRDFAAREQRLQDDLERQCAAAERAHQNMISRETERVTEEVAGIRTAADDQRARWGIQFEQRERRIRQADQSSRKRILDAIDHEEGRAKYQLQKATLQAERQRDTALNHATMVWETSHKQLRESRNAFLSLEYESFRAFGGFGIFRQWLLRPPGEITCDTTGDENELSSRLNDLRESVHAGLDRFGRHILACLFRVAPIWPLVAVLVLGHAAVLFVLPQLGLAAPELKQTGWSLGLSLAVILALYAFGRRQLTPLARHIAAELAEARILHDACEEEAARRRQAAQQAAGEEYERATQQFEEQWREAVQKAEAARRLQPGNADEKVARVISRHRRLHQARVERLELECRETLARIEHETETRRQELATAQQATLTRIQTEARGQWEALAAEWKASTAPICEFIGNACRAAEGLVSPWDDPSWREWQPPAGFGNAVPFGWIEVSLDQLAGTRPSDSRLALPGPPQFRLPLVLVYPHQGSLLFETEASDQEENVMRVLNNILFRLLALTPADKLSLTVLDPVGLGQNFAGLMHLADYENSHLASRIWTQTTQIEERLAELNEHMEKVIQMYLRNEYETIAEYNDQAGVIAEKYHFLIIAGFPVNFSETAARRLLNIAASGARCGVYTLIHWDHRHTLPHDFVPDNLRKSSICMVADRQLLVPAGPALPGTRLLFDPPPAPEILTAFLHRVGRSSKDRNRVEVPFDQVAPAETDVWSVRTAEELVVPIGRSGATKLQQLAIGRGTRQHALIAGKTGSGKSTLFHVIITNLALWCSPEQVEFYLVDFKKGVEFKCYASRRLPHARVVAIESDREFGLSVLQRVDEELRRRGDLFRKLGVQDLPGYVRSGGQEPLPRSLLIIDEFQEFFVEEDRISQTAAVLLDRIVRQGRAFGIHTLLGSQTLGGAYTLARATIGQMVIRIALQCNEADAMLIMDENNAAARLLSRPGEGIYNDSAGALEGNSPFQVVWLPDELRDRHLAAIRQRADQASLASPGPIVFEGNAPADLNDNAAFHKVLDSVPGRPPVEPRIWIGSPNSIKGPTEVVFRRQSGSHLLMVGQREEAMLAMTCIGLVALAAQHSPGTIRFVLLDGTVPGSAERTCLDRVAAMLPDEIVRPGAANLGQVLNDLAGSLNQPEHGDQVAHGIPTFIWIHGLQHFKALRQEDEFGFALGDNTAQATPAARFLNLLNEGPGQGLHVVATCDTYSNVSRYLGRKPLGEFEMRVLFQMSAADSASLVDAPDASTLGLHRALFHNEREGYLEKFRPYALPDSAWFERVARRLTQTRIPGRLS